MKCYQESKLVQVTLLELYSGRICNKVIGNVCSD